MNDLWIYGFCVLCVTVLCVYLYRTRDTAVSTTESAPVIETCSTESNLIPKSVRSPYASIRQMALVQEDEFEQFYLPVLQRINWYEELVRLPRSDSAFQSLILKALRRRKAAIFETDSSEADSVNAPFWTLGLFLAVICRYAVQLLNSCEFTDDNGQRINPHYEKPAALQALNKEQKGLIRHYHSDHVYHHMIDKLISPAVIKMLHERKIYPYVVNAVVGFYEYRQMPFYRIIEEVEDHVYKNDQPLERWRFEYTIKQILDLIENNTVIKNTADALIFEASRYLYIDRHLLWELFKTYYVVDQLAMGKNEFEEKLIDALGLFETSTRHDTVKVYIKSNGNRENDIGAAYLEIKNTIALPYSKIPLYTPTTRLKVERELLEREVILDSDAPSFGDTHTMALNDENDDSEPSKTDQEPVSTLIKKVTKQSSREAVFNENKK